MINLLRILCLVIGVASFPLPSMAQDVFFIPRQSEEPPPEELRPEARKDMYAVVRILEKATARSEKVNLPPDVVVQHKKIKLMQKRCWVDNKGVPPEHAALLEIYGDEEIPSVALNFYGWLFKEQQSLTTFQHPYYDITLLDCLTEEQFNTISKKAEPTTKADNTP
jgi:hypothetical protein